MAVLLDGYLHIDITAPDDPHRDHLIFSKGHASPLYYAMLKAAGAFGDQELLTFRRFPGRLEGHPTPRIPPTDVATGSLGQGLPIGVGIALAGRKLDRLAYRTWVLCGDSEMAEGSIWEAFERAGWSGLGNLTLIVDVNRLGQTRETMLGWDLHTYAARARSFGWNAIEIDGHDLEEIDRAYADAISSERPTAILARTRKGRGVASVENKLGWHGKPLPEPERGDRRARWRARSARFAADARTVVWPAPVHHTGGRHADLEARSGGPDARGIWGGAGGAWPAPGRRRGPRRRGFKFHRCPAVCAGTSRALLRDVHRREQLVAAAVGMQVRHWVAFASTFGAFFARAFDFVRMAAVSRADLRLCGSHAGVSIGEDGPSQMALEDMAAMRTVRGSAVLHPSDANQVVQLVEEMADRAGITYPRTLRSATTVRTAPDEPVRIGGSRIVRESDDDQLTIVACGATVEEAERAASDLARAGRAARVIDCYSVKPIDREG